MAYRRVIRPYGSYPSWRLWRNANLQRLTAAGVPSAACDSEDNWSFFLQEADLTIMGGALFDPFQLDPDQLGLLYNLLLDISEEATGGDLLNLVEASVSRKPEND